MKLFHLVKLDDHLGGIEQKKARSHCGADTYDVDLCFKSLQRVGKRGGGKDMVKNEYD